MGKTKSNKALSIEIDKLTNSIENAISGETFKTEFQIVNSRELKSRDWLFDWKREITDRNNIVFKMYIIENKNIIQGLISMRKKESYIFINLVENANFNRGKNKLYLGVGGNLFAFACLTSMNLGFQGFVAFDAKTALVKHYQTTIGAEKATGQRMYISDNNAQKLINQYFKK